MLVRKMSVCSQKPKYLYQTLLGAKIDTSIDKAEKKIETDLDKVKSELSGAKSDIERWIDKADKAGDAASSEFKK